jgi:carbonic anhydrase/acetyltransferase-like protein (isoleucine patch superfamily)
MPIYALGDLTPEIDRRAWVHPDAVVIGDVVLGPEVSVWPCAVLRGDIGRIQVGERTSIQDGCVIHTTHEEPTLIGSGCVIGHTAYLEGCVIGDGVLIGAHACVLPRARIDPSSVVAAAALVPVGMTVPSGSRARGVPARIDEGTVTPGRFTTGVPRYVQQAARYRRELRRIA